MSRIIAPLLVALVVLFAGSATSRAQDSTPAAAGEVQQFAEDTYAFVSGGYVSLFIVTDEGVIVTDPSSLVDPDRADALKAAIASVTDAPVRYVIYSHDHADHATGGAVFADSATFISHRDAAPKIAALDDPRTPAPQITFTDELALTVGGKQIELYFTGRNHSDNSIVLLYPERRLLYAVDFIPVDSLPYQDLPEAYPVEWIASLQWVEDNLDFDTLVIGHPPVSGAKANVGQVRAYLEDLIAAVHAAQDQGLADNSPEMIASVRTALAPEYASWANFAEWLPLNIEGLLRVWTAAAATPTG